MSLIWADLRPWGGTQQGGFEELCVQLAASERMPAGARFFRKGVPDAGIEGFWTLASGDEWAWQAKFFLNKPTQSQWADLSESIFRALLSDTQG